MSEQDVALDDFGDQNATEKIEGNDVKSTHPRFGKLPSEWTIKEISEIADVVGGSTPSTDNDDYWRGGIPWATPTDITELSGNEINETADTLTEEGLNSASTHLLPAYSVLMTSRATIGKCAVNTVEMATNQGFKSLIPSKDVETWYLHYRMLQTAPFLESLGTGSTFDEVSKSVAQSIDIPLPPLEEQRNIASVLYTVDQTIQKSQRIVGKISTIRKGVRNELTTTGIDQGELEDIRFGPISSRIPSHWQKMTVDELTRTIYRYPTYQDIEYVDNGVPEARIGMLEGDGTINRDSAKYIPESVSKKYPETILDQGDTLMAVRGATLGKIGHVPEWLDGGNINPNLIRIAPNEHVRDRYLTELFLSDLVHRQIQSYVRQTTLPTITAGDIRKIAVPLPSKEEQAQILRILSSFNSLAEKEREGVQLIKRIKKGLLHDLLSGEVRTHDKDIEVIDEVLAYG